MTRSARLERVGAGNDDLIAGRQAVEDLDLGDAGGAQAAPDGARATLP